jgi:small-conductance mechanosensitive channel
MTRKGRLSRIFWPAVLFAAGVVAYAAHEEAAAALGLDLDPGVVRLLTGGACYFAAAWLGSRLVGIALMAKSRQRVPKLLQEILTAVFFFVALIATAMLVLGLSVSGALASSGIVVAVVGFAIRNVVADTLSGIALGLEAPYRIGDWVDIDGVINGRVVEIGWRTSRLLSRDSTYMIVPNSQIARQKLTNFSAPQKHYRAQLQITLNHRVDAASAKRILVTAAKRSTLILSEPAPDARVLVYSTEGIVYAVRYWVPSFANDIDCRDSVLSEIDAALRAAMVPPPQRALQLV